MLLQNKNAVIYGAGGAVLLAGSHTRRLSTLVEMANMAVFMASDKASGMTGTMGSLDD